MDESKQKIGFWRSFIILVAFLINLSGYIFVGVMLVGVVYSYQMGYTKSPALVQDPVSTQPAQAAPTEVDPQIALLASELKINLVGLKVVYTDSFQDQEQGGLFDGLRTITIKRGGNLGLSESAELAHEYMHYVWLNGLSPEYKTSFTVVITDLYNSDPDVQVRMEPYVAMGIKPGSQEFANELHSIYCTESSDKWLTSPVLDECNKWFYRPALQFTR